MIFRAKRVRIFGFSVASLNIQWEKGCRPLFRFISENRLLREILESCQFYYKLPVVATLASPPPLIRLMFKYFSAVKKGEPSRNPRLVARGVNEVRRRQDASLAPRISNLRSFGSIYITLNKVLLTLLGLLATLAVIQRPRVIRRPRNCAPLISAGLIRVAFATDTAVLSVLDLIFIIWKGGC